MTGSLAQRRGLAERLAAGVVVCDGAMGTMLHAAGVSFDRALSQLNLTRPDLVSDIHRAYLDAGAAIIETNTFDANRYRLARHGLAGRAAAFNRTGAELAVRARAESGSDALVAGSIGPLFAPGSREADVAHDTEDAIAEAVEALVDGGVDLLMFETFGNLANLVRSVRAAQRATDVPIVAHMTFLEDSRTIGGDRPEAVAHAAEELGVAAVGLNCTLGPQAAGQVLDELAAATDLPLSALPNAGIPARIGDHFHYPANEEYFARAARGFVERGATIVGGCCGTTPRHIAAIGAAVAEPLPRPRSSGARAAATLRSPVSISARGSFAERAASGAFTLACELPPNPGADGKAALEAARHVAEAGADVVVVPAPRSSRPQIGVVPLGVLLRHQVEIETILTATTWDKSLLGLQADLLGAHAFGLRTVICRTGGPIPEGDYPGGGIWDVDSVGLIELLHSLNSSGGTQGISFHIGASANPNAHDSKAEVGQARRKIDAGAHFLVTNPVFDLAGLRQLTDKLDRPGVPILLGVTPLRDFAHAEYLHQEVPDTDLPAGVLERMRDAGADGARVGREIAAELVAEAAGLVAGVILSAPTGLGLGETAEVITALRAAVA